MSEFPFDLNSILAHLAPGLIALFGISRVSGRVRGLFQASQGEHSAAAIAALTLLSLFLGLTLNNLRHITLDQARSLDLSFSRNSGSLAAIDLKRIRYDKLVNEGHLAAYREAKQEEQVRYQFYGNAIVALAIFGACRAVQRWRSGDRSSRLRSDEQADVQPDLACWKEIGLVIFMMVALFPAYRTYNQRFAEAIHQINNAPVSPGSKQED